MKILVCVDDTDDLTKTTSTGTIAELLMEEAKCSGCAIERGITRHQLLLHEDIKYTSHNSSMCFAAQLDCPAEERDGFLENFWERGVQTIRDNMAEVADPGLCLCRMDLLKDANRLISFGRRAQREVLYKEEALQVAAQVGGIRLEELGGTGAGIIGALAGVGLRLTGNDGTLRGKASVGQEKVTLPAAELAQKLRADQIITTEGETISDDELVFIKKNAKLALLNHRITVVVKKEGNRYEVCNKDDLFDGSRRNGNWVVQCPDFAVDNDYEECFGEEEDSAAERACYNCLYRRWTDSGFSCVHKAHEA